jgi:hypothetical protein
MRFVQAVFGLFCSAVRTQDKCEAQGFPPCAWRNNACAPAAPPPPPPPPPPAPPAPVFRVGADGAKFYAANLLCELDAPNEVSENSFSADLMSPFPPSHRWQIATSLQIDLLLLHLDHNLQLVLSSPAASRSRFITRFNLDHPALCYNNAPHECDSSESHT